MPKLATFRAKRDSAQRNLRPLRPLLPHFLHSPFSTWTWTRSSFRSNCWTGPSCAASQSSSAGSRTSAALFPRQAMRRESTAFIRRCRCALPGGCVRTRFFSSRGTISIPSGATASRRSSENIRRSWKWLRWTRRISILPGRSGCTGRRSRPRDALLREITATTGLPCSAGLARTRLVAKVASDQAKPRGLVWVPAGSEEAFLAPLDVRRIPGNRQSHRGGAQSARASKRSGNLPRRDAGKTRAEFRPLGHGALPQSARRRHLRIFRGCGAEIHFAQPYVFGGHAGPRRARRDAQPAVPESDEAAARSGAERLDRHAHDPLCGI